MKKFRCIIMAALVSILSFTVVFFSPLDSQAFVVRDRNSDLNSQQSEETSDLKPEVENIDKKIKEYKIKKIVKKILISLFAVVTVVASCIVGKSIYNKIKNKLPDTGFTSDKNNIQPTDPLFVGHGDTSNKNNISDCDTSTLIYTEYENDSDRPVYEYDNIIKKCKQFELREDKDSNEYKSEYMNLRKDVINQCNENIRFINHYYIARDEHPALKLISDCHREGYTIIDENGNKSYATRDDIIAELRILMHELHYLPSAMRVISSHFSDQSQDILINRFNFLSSYIKKNRVNKPEFEKKIQEEFGDKLEELVYYIKLHEHQNSNYDYKTNKEYIEMNKVMYDYTR